MRTHRFEPASFVFGLLFVAAGLSFLTGDVDLWRLDWSWFWPIALTVAGVAILASARRSRDEAPGDAPPAPDDDLTW